MTYIKLRIYSTSSPAWQPVKDGKPFNKWVGTVTFACTEQYACRKRFIATITGSTEQEVANKLDKYVIGTLVNINPTKLHKRFGSEL